MVKLIKDTCKDLFLFLLNPVDQPNVNQSLQNKFTRLFIILLLDFTIVAIWVTVVSILEYLGWFSMGEHSITEFLNSTPIPVIIILLVFVIPLLEEVIFRLYLRYQTNYILRFFLLIFYVAGKDKKEQVEDRIKTVWHKKYAYVFYFSVLLFGFIHIFNFEASDKLWLVIPLITLPQLVAGALFGYLRVQYNLTWGYAMHALHNSIVLLPFLFLGPDFASTNKYSIIIKEASGESRPSVKYEEGFIHFQNMMLKDIIAHNSKKELWMLESNNEEKINKVLNLHYQTKSLKSGADHSDHISKYLAAYYNYDIIKESRLTAAWKLSITDTLKLLPYRTDSITHNFINYSPDSAIIHGTQFPGIAFAIQKSTNKGVFTYDNINGNFSLKFNTKDTTELKNTLTSMYGLQLSDTTINIEYWRIEFKEQPFDLAIDEMSAAGFGD